MSGNEPIYENKTIQVRTQGEFNKKSPKVHHDQQQGNCPEGAPANVVGKRDRHHAKAFYPKSLGSMKEGSGRLGTLRLPPDVVTAARQM